MIKSKKTEKSAIWLFQDWENRFSLSVNISAPWKKSAGLFFSTLLLTISLTSYSSPAAHAEESKVMQSSAMTQMPFGERKNLSGEVSASNNEGVALLKSGSSETVEKEIWLPFAEGIRLNGYHSVKDIVSGDKVVAIYEEGGEGGKRLLRELTFVQRAPQQPEAAEEVVEEAPLPEDAGTEVTS